MKKIIKVIFMVALLVSLLPIMPVIASDGAINAENYDKEALERAANGTNVLYPDTHEYLAFNDSEILVLEAWGASLKNYSWEFIDVNGIQYVKHTLIVEEMDGYDLPTPSAKGDMNLYATLSKSTIKDYTNNEFTINQDGTGTLSFNTEAKSVNKISRAAIIVSSREGDSLEQDYRKAYNFIDIHHFAKDLNSGGPTTNQSFSLGDTGYRVYMVRKKKDLIVYTLNTKFFKHAYTNYGNIPEKYAFESSDDFGNRYIRYTELRGDKSSQIAYTTTNFYVKLWTDNAWNIEGEYDYYHVSNNISMREMASKLTQYPGNRITSMDVQVYDATTNMWLTKNYGLDEVYTTQKENFNVQWTQGSDLQKKQVDLYISGVYEKEYNVNYVLNDGTDTIYKDTTAYIKGENVSLTSLEETGFVREKYDFIGWNTASNGSGQFVEADFLMNDADVTLYATWKLNETDEPIGPEEPIVPVVPPVTPTIPPTIPTAPQTPPTPVIVTPVVNTPQPEVVEEVEVVEQQDTPKAKETEKVSEKETPKANGNQGNWALINLICTVVTAGIALLLLIFKHKREDDEENCDEESTNIVYTRRRWTKGFAIIVGIVSIVMFILTENMSLPMILIDKWTIVMAIVLLIQVVTWFIARKWKEVKEVEETKA